METITLFGASVGVALDVIIQFFIDALVLIGSSIIIYIFSYALAKTCGIDLPLPGRVLRFVVGLLALPMLSSRTPTARFMTLWDRLRCLDFGKRTRLGLPTTYQGFALHPAKGWFLTREKSCVGGFVYFFKYMMVPHARKKLSKHDRVGRCGQRKKSRRGDS